jgi:FlaA1/EpsC-like NDP-sugar epimerase
LTSKRGQGSSLDWKPNLRRNIAAADLIALILTLVFILSVRFPETWRGELTNYEIKNIVLALLVLGSWLFFLWFNGSRDINILGFGADEYKKLINATLLSFTSVAFVSYIFKLEISRLFVLSVFPFGLLVLFVVRRILRRRLLKARNQGRYLSRVLLLHSGSSDPVEQRLALAQHAGFNVVYKIVQ